MLNLRAKLQSIAELRAAMKPNGRTHRAFPDVLFDSPEYAAAGQTTLAAFDAVRADKTISNMKLAGQLPAGEYFEIHRVVVQPLIAPTTAAGGNDGAIDDVILGLTSSRPTITLAVGSVEYVWPADWCLGPGGLVLNSAGTFTAEEQIQFASTAGGGGFPVAGQLIIGEGESFGATYKWNAAQAVSAAYRLRTALFGMHYVPVN